MRIRAGTAPKITFRTNLELKRRVKTVAAAFGKSADLFCHEAVEAKVVEYEQKLLEKLQRETRTQPEEAIAS
jgi:predicted DNA-binding protein